MTGDDMAMATRRMRRARTITGLSIAGIVAVQVLLLAHMLPTAPALALAVALVGASMWAHGEFGEIQRLLEDRNGGAGRTRP